MTNSPACSSVGRYTHLGLAQGSPGDPWHASSPPIYQTATFAQEEADAIGAFEYSRSGNPTRETLERHCARLEGATGACAFSSGVAALAAVSRLVRCGERIVVHNGLYGGTQRLLSRLAEDRGVEVVWCDLIDGDVHAAAVGARLILVESLTNPLWRAPDLRALAAASRRAGAWLAVDATATSPWIQRPIEHGADIVIHSATKILSGHADLTAGLVALAGAELHQRIAFIQNAEGAALAPFDSWLLLRGMRTLGVRLERQQQTASEVASWLASRSDVRVVHHPSLPSHPDHALHRTQADGPGCVLSFELGDEQRSLAVVAALARFAITVSFGSVDSTVSVPCRMSHASVPPALRHVGMPPRDLIRLSIGLEDAPDLIADLDQALDQAGCRASRSSGMAVLRDAPSREGGSHLPPKNRLMPRTVT
jgi:cystathionine beta-lyase